MEALNILLLNIEEQIKNKDDFIKELAGHIRILNQTQRGTNIENEELKENSFQRVQNALYTLELDQCLHLRINPGVDPEYWKQKARLAFEEMSHCEWVYIGERFENLA